MTENKMSVNDVSRIIESLPSSLRSSIKNIIGDEGFAVCEVEIRKFDSGGGNFMGDLYEIDIKGKTEENEKEINLFIKKKVILNKINFILVDDIFSKEHFFYTDLLKVFEYLQDKANIPVQKRYRAAKPYNAFNKDAIILENLLKRDFKTYTRSDVIPLKYAELAIKELAKFHGLSFVIEINLPEYFKKNIKTLENSFRYNDDWRLLIQKACKYIGNMFIDDPAIKRKIENYFPIILEKFPKYNSSNINVKCALTHGDYRMNNVLVREQDGIPIEVVPVDYQLIDYGCPIRDFLFFIFSGTDQEFRRKNLENLKELYFSSLSKYLKLFNMNVEDVYPRSEFEKSYNESMNYALMMMIFCITFLFAPETGVNMTDINLSDMPLNFDARSQRLIREFVEDFVQWGYL